MKQGVYTAIVTPFTDSGEIDWDALKKLVEVQIAGGVTGIVPCGTTGESPTLSEEEHLKVIENVVKWVDKRCLVVAGTGSNSTAKTIATSRKAEARGVDGLLVVNPYYNKPTQEGLYRHFKAVADAVSIPLVLYNIKGRTGVNVETQTLMRIVKACKNVTSVKEASGDLEQMKAVIAARPEGFLVLSGDDGITLNLIKAGGDGLISVASNLLPGKVVAMVDAALKKEWEAAGKLDAELQPFFEGEFMETNPLPIKAALAMKGMIKENYRLPMCEMSKAKREKWKAILEGMGLV